SRLDASARVHARRKRHTDRGQPELGDELQPIPSGGVGVTEPPCDRRAEERGDDADDDGEPDRDGLLAGQNQPREDTEHQTHQDRGDDSRNLHGARSVQSRGQRPDRGTRPYRLPTVRIRRATFPPRATEEGGPSQATPVSRCPARTVDQNAASSTSMRSLSAASTIARRAESSGSTFLAKNDATAILPW